MPQLPDCYMLPQLISHSKGGVLPGWVRVRFLFLSWNRKFYENTLTELCKGPLTIYDSGHAGKVKRPMLTVSKKNGNKHRPPMLKSDVLLTHLHLSCLCGTTIRPVSESHSLQPPHLCPLNFLMLFFGAFAWFSWKFNLAVSEITWLNSVSRHD